MIYEVQKKYDDPMEGFIWLSVEKSGSRKEILEKYRSRLRKNEVVRLIAVVVTVNGPPHKF